MRRLRFYCQNIDSVCILDEEQSHHLSRVLRVEEGDTVDVFDGRGTLAEGTVERIDRRQVSIRTSNISRIEAPRSSRLILAVSIAKGQRFDWMIEKCTELGADHIAAVQFERTVKLGSENTVERLRKISLSAAKQCGRLFLPEISGPLPLEQSLAGLKKQYPNAVLCCGEPQGQPFASFLKEFKERDLIVLIGSEGGFSASENDWLTSERIEKVSINSNVLRVETAAVAFCAIAKATH